MVFKLVGPPPFRVLLFLVSLFFSTPESVLASLQLLLRYEGGFPDVL